MKRRDFVKTIAAAASLAIVPSYVSSGISWDIEAHADLQAFFLRGIKNIRGKDYYVGAWFDGPDNLKAAQTSLQAAFNRV